MHQQACITIVYGKQVFDLEVKFNENRAVLTGKRQADMSDKTWSVAIFLGIKTDVILQLYMEQDVKN